MKKRIKPLLIIFLLIFFSFANLNSLNSQTKTETKAFIENIKFHNPSKYQHFYYSFLFKSDKQSFSIVEKCPPKTLNANEDDFMVFERYDVENKEYDYEYVRVSHLSGYKIKLSGNIYYIELQTNGNDKAFFYGACGDEEWPISFKTISTASYDDAIKFLKAMKHLCNLYDTSFIDLENLF